MKKILLSAALVLVLAGCGSQKKAPQTSSSSSVKISKQAAPKKRPNTKAGMDDLIGHYWVNTADASEVLQITASTDGYFVDVQRYSQAQAGYATASAGVFAARLVLRKHTYTFTGRAQPNAQSSTWVFQKLSATKIKQLPDGPLFRQVKNDDLSTIKH
ncbi:hypothetical protein [Lacticaseibacillus sp. 866-1]|uniref:hypothetical protein n=1 Tax=Lacticaseibacillus sp. 866-1 TaxID=2799576 RepID=UPI0019426148|nr:hypothetical protein [Lacticaseibacillus sp. 866-1]